jgi:bacillolysin
MKKVYNWILVFILLTDICFQVNAQKIPTAFSKKEKHKTSTAFQIPVKTVVNKKTGSGITPYKPLRFSGHSDSLKNLNVHRSEKGLPIYIKGSMNKKFSDLSSKEQIRSACHSYLKGISSLIGIKDPASEFEVYSIINDALGMKHVRLNQKYSGVPVYGAEIIIHFKADSVQLFNGRHYPTPSFIDVKPALAYSNAIQKAIEDVSTITSYKNLSPYQKKLLNYESPGSELVLYQAHEKENLELAWHVTVRPNLLEDWEYFINAKTGMIIYKANRTCTTGPGTANATDLNGVSRQLNTYVVGSTNYLIDASKFMFNLAQSPNLPNNPVGAIWTLDANNTDLTSVLQDSSLNNVWSDPSAVSAHYHAGICYDYYKSTFNRNSLDSAGGTIMSVVNVTQNGASMENAYWNGQFMAYGNGGTYFKPLAGGLDVTGHELTHGVISKTANLQYSYQSGAINESMADVFGCMVDRNDWQIGEDIVIPASFPSGALRDISDPHNGSTPGDFRWQPKSMTEFVNTSSDHGGVHVNSGIPNFAFYLFATSASVTKSMAEQVYYRALTTYLVNTSQFIDLRLAIIHASDDLYPAGSLVSNAAKAAFDSVHIYDGAATTVQNNVPIHPGQDYILAEGTFGDPTSLYILDYVNGTTDSISSTPVNKKPSLTDDGSTAYFVSEDNNIRRIYLNPSSPQETIIDGSGSWDNVAVSKDGTKLAATTTDSDSAIYIYDFISSRWSKFHLYNPTYSTGISTDGPIYADGLEWDYSGENVIYDCYNKVPAGSSNIDYWDIGIIKVWDKTNDTFGDGTIEKLFNELPANVDIGNPTFAKNSTNIIAFDLIDYNSGQAYIYACNTETLDNNPLTTNYYMLGFPSFSNDDKHVAFSSLNPFSGGDTCIAIVDLNPDKISPVNNPNNPYPLINFVEMPVWYAKGSRITGTTKADPAVPSIQVFPNPFDDQVFINYELSKNEMVDISVYNTLGQPLRKLLSENETVGLHKHTFALEGLCPGTYFIKILTGPDFQTFKIVKLQ